MGAHGPVYRWEFEKRGRPVTVSLTLIANDVELTLRAALAGVGLAFALEEHAAGHIARGELVRALEDWCPSFDNFFRYPSRRN
jgi:DNA-binding transcriptional LysR family regulator